MFKLILSSFLFLNSTHSLALSDSPPSFIKELLKVHKQANETRSQTQACRKFTRLSKNKKYPLQEIALFKKNILCSQSDSITPTSSTKWARSLELKLELKNALAEKQYNKAFKLEWNSTKSINKIDKFNNFNKLVTQYSTYKADDLKETIKTIRNKVSPSTITDPKKDEFLKIAYDYKRQRNFKQAHNYFNKHIKSHKSFMQKLKGLRGISFTYKTMRELTKHQESFLAILNFIKKKYKKKKSKVIGRKLFNYSVEYARILWTQNKREKARSILKKIIYKRFSFLLPRENAMWVLARIYEEKHHYKSARYWYKKALKSKSLDTDLKEKIYWFLSWSYFKTQDFKTSQKQLVTLYLESNHAMTKAKSLFWQALCFERQKKYQKFASTIKQLNEEFSFNYYNVASHYLLKKPMDNIFFKKNLDKDSIIIYPKDPLFKTAYYLFFAGEKDLLTSYLSYVATQLVSNDDQARDELNKWYAFNENYVRLFSYVYKQSNDILKMILLTHPKMLLPTPYLNTIKKAEDHFGVEKEFTLAIARQESAFNPKATSVADAKGLMQLLPTVAKSTANKHNLPYQEANDLYIPEVNISLGVATLKSKSVINKGHFITTVASYNASQSVINKWIETRYRNNTLEFIEDIPYEETKGYVKLVMRNYIFYKMLLSDKKTIELPKWLFSL